MNEFYNWIEAARLFLTFFIALAVLCQTLATVLSFNRHHSRRRFFENILEACVLTQVLACSLLHGQVIHNYENSLIGPTGYGALRIACFAAVLLMAVIVLMVSKKPWPLLIVVASGLTLPMMEVAFGNVFAYLYLTAILFWLARSIHICSLRYRELRISISALSIKNTIDSLHTGVLFSEQDGFILLSNAQMQRMMKVIVGRIQRNGNYFYELLAMGDMQPGCQKAELEGQIVCLLPDETAWMFTKTELQIKRKKYIQLTATDITRRWALTARLQQQEAKLKSKQEELSRALKSLHILSHEKETQKAKMRAHDILGQRLTLLLRTIRSDQALDYDLLRSLSQGLLDDLKADKNAPFPQDELDGLQQAFGSIGVEIEQNGKLPEDRAYGRLFTDIIRESVTNAVRHGFATKIFVQMDFTDGEYRLKITNNGHSPSGPIVEGGGIGGMRKMVEPHGGALDVTAYPRFVLTVNLPGGETGV